MNFGFFYTIKVSCSGYFLNEIKGIKLQYTQFSGVFVEYDGTKGFTMFCCCKATIRAHHCCFAAAL
uniref:Uncharacterized protein n=1 Tax=Oryza brachyantha TaxID=4533 RepID=J3KTY6_ORYBR